MTDESRKQAAQELLQAWLTMSLSIRGNRVLQDLTFNEMAVCNALLTNQYHGGSGLTAAELCQETKLLKSQMNKVLSELENRGIIEKTAAADKRKTIIRFVSENAGQYWEEHQRVIQLFEGVTERLGQRRTIELAASIKEATEIAEELISKE